MDSTFEGINKKCRSPRKSSSFACSIPTPMGKARGAKGPTFEDGPDSEAVFRLFHRQNGAVPLAGISFVVGEPHVTANTETGPQFDPIAAKAATISHSPLWSGGHFGFDSVFEKWNERFLTQVVKVRAKGPIFEDGPDLEATLRLCQRQNGAGSVLVAEISSVVSEPCVTENAETGPQFDPLAARAAAISRSALGAGGPFGFDSFSTKWNKQNKKASNYEPISQSGGNIASCCTVGSATSSATKFTGHSPCLKFRCPRPVVAVRAGPSHSEPWENLRPQALPSKMLVIALLDMAAKLLLGVLREHATKFSLPWFEAIHAAMQFIAMLMLLYPVRMPKTAMVFILSAFILGLMIGLRAEQKADAVMEDKWFVNAKLGPLFYN